MSANESPETRDTLLLRIRDDADRDAWDEFSSIYRPLIYRLARGRGLQDADAQDLIQKVMISVARRIDDWQTGQGSGSFRKWLSRVAHNAAIDHFRRRKPDAPQGGSDAANLLNHEPDEPISEGILKQEYQREVFRWAARRIRSEFRSNTWDAFWMTCVDEVSIEETADQLGRSIGSVYTARSRVMQRLREVVKEYDVAE